MAVHEDEERRLLDLIQRHAALLVSGFALAFVVLRVVAVSDQDPATALAVVQTAGTTSVVVGTLVQLVTVAIAGAIAPLALFAWMDFFKPSAPGERWPTKRRRAIAPRTAFDVALLAAVVATAIAITPWTALLAYTAIGVIGVVVGRIARPGDSLRRSPQDYEWDRSRSALQLAYGLIGASIAFAMIVGAIARTPWMPPEEIHLKSGGVLVGFVLSQDQQETSVLLDRDRSVVHLDRADVIARTVCRTTDLRKQTTGFLSGKSLRAAVSGGPPPRYPSCRSSRPAHP